MENSQYTIANTDLDHISSVGHVSIDLIPEKHWSSIKKHFSISPRELDVAKLVCQGLNNTEIAVKLKITPGTVKAHLQNIFLKTHRNTKIKLLLLFVEGLDCISGKSNGIAADSLNG